MELILLRHGATEGNLLHQYIGRTDLPLCPQGVEQAQRLQGRLPKPDVLFVSPMQRCTMTAALIWPDVPRMVIQDLREADFGLFEQKTWQQLKDDSRYRDWIDGRADCPGGEPRDVVSARIPVAGKLCVSTALERGAGLAAVVAHGGTIMELLHHYFDGNYYDWQTELCHGWIVTVEKDGRLTNARRLYTG